MPRKFGERNILKRCRFLEKTPSFSGFIFNSSSCGVDFKNRNYFWSKLTSKIPSQSFLFREGKKKLTASLNRNNKHRTPKLQLVKNPEKKSSLFHEKRLGLDHQASQVPTNRKGRRMFCINPTPATVAVKNNSVYS